MALVRGRSSLFEGLFVDWVVARSQWTPPLPVTLLDRVETAAELERVQADRARLAAYEAELMMRLAAHTQVLSEGHPAAGASSWTADPGLPEVDEACVHELAMILNCGRRSASIRAARAWTWQQNLPATWARLAAGTLDEPRALALVDVLEHAANRWRDGWRPRSCPRRSTCRFRS